MRGSLILSMLLFSLQLFAQDKKAFSISGTMGATYEGYWLTTKPAGWNGYTARRPANQFRFNFSPNMKFGKFKLPFNVNFATKPTNFAGPYAGIAKQSVGQFLTNPMNNFGVNPSYKWAELQLGTQYLKYSDLSTGDIGIFGAGFDLRPGTYRFKFFTGVSQQGINYVALPIPGVQGAFKRTNYMFQLGKEREGKYELAFNFSKGKDNPTSSSPPPVTIKPQEGFTMSLVTNVFFKGGWYFKSEAARSLYTRNVNDPAAQNPSFKPFIDGHTSTVLDYAAQGSIGKKSKDFDIGATVKYLGAGFQTTGYPYLQPDKLDYTINTRINTWKNKMNIVASLGQRVNNVSNTATKAKQFIANVNWFTQFDDQFSLNMSFNNFGFNTTGVTMNNIPSLKNVSNDLGINPTYTWSNSKMSNLLSLSYNYSKYTETTILGNVTTSSNNTTHTVLLTYVPTFLTKEISPDFSALYFHNNTAGAAISLLTFSAGVSAPLAKKKVQLRAQLQYTIGKLNTFSNNKNFVGSANVDVKLSKKLNWNNSFTSNYFKYGDELGPPYIGANYFENMVKTGLVLRFGK